MPDVGAALLGPGMLGSALAANLLASDAVDLRLVAGQEGDGVELDTLAAGGVETSELGINAVLDRNDIELVFDATTEAVQGEHAVLLLAAGKRVVDLTPSGAELAVVPLVNLDSALGRRHIHLVSSAAQLAVPVIHALAREVGVEHAEIVATIAGASAGPGTRLNIDGLTAGTATAANAVGGAADAKAMIFFGPGGPGRAMMATIFMRLRGPDEQRALATIGGACERLGAVLPGLELGECTCDDDVVTVRVELGGSGEEGAVAPSLAPIVVAATAVGEALSGRFSGARS